MSYSIDKMNIFEAKSAFSKDSLFHCDHMENYVFPKMNKFKENEQFSVVLSIGQQNDHFQGISCIRFQRRYTVQCIFIKNEQNEHISRKSSKLKKYLIPMDFQKRVSYRLQFLHRKLPIFSEITDSKEIKEISNFGQFSKDSLLPFRLKWTKWTVFSEISWSQEITKMNRFQWF